MVEIKAKITFDFFAVVRAFSHLMTQKADVCRRTPTGFTHTAMNKQAGTEAQMRVDESEYTHGGAVQHCFLTCEDVFHILHYNSVSFGFISQLYKMPAHALSSQMMLRAPFT